MGSKISRRTFVMGALTAASAMRVVGANDRIRLGAVGTGGRGRYLMKRANEVGNIEWIAVSDIWDERCRLGEEEAGVKVDRYNDYRRLLDRKEIDGVIVATFDHMHAQITADACRAGKDVYVEKPMTSLPEQGRPIVEAARETGRVIQVGMQQRSTPHFQEAKRRFFDSGVIGKVDIVRTVWNGNSGYTAKVPAGMEKKPPGLDWDACRGWLPKIPWDPKQYFNRFAYWDFATGGQTGGLFVHLVDVVHWFLGLRRAEAAVAMGGIYRHIDGRDTPDTVNLALRYPQKVNVTFEASLANNLRDADIVFAGTGGTLSIFRYGYKFVPAGADDKRDPVTADSTRDTHMANWLDAMRTRKQPNADAVEGHYSSMACHIGNIAYREKTQVSWHAEWDV